MENAKYHPIASGRSIPAGVEAVRRGRSIALAPRHVLFLCLFSGQAAVLVLVPLLPQIAAEFDVPVGAVGQLRALSGLVAGVSALALASIGPRLDLRRALVAGASMLALGSALSVAAPDFVILAMAQVPVGLGLAFVVSAAIAATGEWSEPGERARLLSWALLGQPVAWIVGTPLAGIVAASGWRTACSIPAIASILTLIALARLPVRPSNRSRSMVSGTTGEPAAVAIWIVGELLAYAGWSGFLVYSAALFIQAYGTSPAAAALLVTIGAVSYLPGNVAARRLAFGHRLPLILLAMGLGGGILVFGAVRLGVPWSAGVVTLLGVLAGFRTFLASAFGMHLATDDKMALMSLRTAATQFGYVIGASLGGAALVLGGYPALGVVLAAMFGLAALVHSCAAWNDRRHRDRTVCIGRRQDRLRVRRRRRFAR
jgi:DHA1 family inner membrane transport protein